MLLAGDLNCVLNAAEGTGHTQTCRALAIIVRGSDLRTCWIRPDQILNTHSTLQNRRPDWTATTLLDGRSCISKELRQQHPLWQITELYYYTYRLTQHYQCEERIIGKLISPTYTKEHSAMYWKKNRPGEKNTILVARVAVWDGNDVSFI